jgi:DNA-binding transcriptional LysR family regulator
MAARVGLRSLSDRQEEPPMTLKQLQYFMAVASTLNFTEAAQRQFVSQPAMSRSIGALEEELHVTLLTRTNHGVSLTPAGMLLAAELPKLKNELERLVMLVRQTEDGILGRLNIGVLDGQQMDESILVTFKYFSQNVPLIEVTPVRLTAAALMEQLACDKLDLAVTLSYALSAQPGLSQLELDSIPACILLRGDHPLAEAERAELAAFRGETFLVPCGDTPTAELNYVYAACRKAGFEPAVRKVPDVQTQALWIESGFGVALANLHATACAAPGLKALELPELPKQTLTLCWRSDTLNPSVRLFTHLTECCL